MSDRFIIQTNLTRGLILYTLILLSMTLYYLLNRHTGILITLLLTVGIFLNYILSKQLFLITEDKGKVKLKYLQFLCKVKIIERELLYIRKRIEVTFRGGKNEIFEIRNKKTEKKILEVSKRQFKTDGDYKMFTDLFEISLGGTNIQQ